MNILITGSTGFVGHELIQELILQGHELTALVRDVSRAKLKFDHELIEYIHWPNIYSEFSTSKKHFHALINLMGENIAAKRWSAQRKVELFNSRVNGTEALLKRISQQGIKIDTLIQGSATGFYGSDLFTDFSEESAPGKDFLANLCVHWERICTKEPKNFKRTCYIRTGMVIGKNGGACSKILPIFKMGLGGRLGSGTQYMPWIHLSDLVRIIIEALENEEMVGPINAVSPNLIDNREFTQVIGKVLGKPVVLPAPSFALKLMLGEMSTMLLWNARVLPKRLEELGFKYDYPDIESAMKQVVVE
jgi:uncharacterized protein (TIGR01777 family)